MAFSQTRIAIFVREALALKDRAEVQHPSLAEYFAECKALSQREQALLYRDYPNSHEYIRKGLGEYCKALDAEGLAVPYSYIPTPDPLTGKAMSNPKTGKVQGVYGYMREQEPYRSMNKKETSERFQKRHRQAATIFPPARELMDLATSLLDARGWSPIMAGLLCLTGRRQFEIGVTALVSPVENHPYLLAYAGQAKTRNEERAADIHLIPVFAPATRICESIERLRTMRAFPSDSDEFDNSTEGTLSNASKRHFNRFFPGRSMNPAELRKVYVAYAYYWFRHNETPSGFINTRLGHLEGAYGSATHYEDYWPYELESDMSLNREELQQ